MAKIQCKMCGGLNDLPDGATSGECPYCGSLTTFPKIDDAQTERLYIRAEHFRRGGCFDKAVAAYESILNRNGEDPEAWWGLLISRYGIEYVEDPATHERIPTCHRMQFESILADSDYLNALKYASGAERDIYEREAQRISELQKDILRISAQEKPCDVFLCCKESTDGGARTKDSVIAQDIYHQLAKRGLNVFFSRITLEKKPGERYEPHIFAALNSAKVMLVIGTKKEHFEAVWVKNEWSRFLALMRKDPSRLLIPCYRDMNVYDIPEELSVFQCQDMGRIGFMQDILLGIEKVVNAGEAEAKIAAGPAASAPGGNVDGAKIMKLIPILLEQREWDEAKDYCRKMLESDPENPELYLFRCLIAHRVPNETALTEYAQELDEDRNFRTALRFASPERRSRLEKIMKPDYLEHGDETILLPGDLKLELVKVRAGMFEMSADDGENRPDETPHRATLTRDFYIAQTQVTQAQWRALTGSDPSHFKGDDLPVEKVSWNEAMSFCEKLNETGKAPDGWMFTLPTETQWEYAARGGCRSRGFKYCGGDELDKVAWFAGNAEGKTHPVKRKRANELGLYDMSGNVWEWCLDDRNCDTGGLRAEFSRKNDRENALHAVIFGGSFRSLRGGCWSSPATECRASARSAFFPAGRGSGVGFRPALVPVSR